MQITCLWCMSPFILWKWNSYLRWDTESALCCGGSGQCKHVHLELHSFTITVGPELCIIGANHLQHSVLLDFKQEAHVAAGCRCGLRWQDCKLWQNTFLSMGSNSPRLTSPLSFRICWLNSLPSRHRKSSPGSRMPHFVAMARAVLMLSPVTIRTVMPARWHLEIASGTWGVGKRTRCTFPSELEREMMNQEG